MLYYIHGYLSNPNSTKGTLFNEKLDAKAICYRSCEPEDLVIADCLKQINNEIINDKNVILIGSSLGGFLAAVTALNSLNVKKLILLNPAVILPSEDISKLQGVPKRILNEMKNNNLFEKKIEAEIAIIMGTEDDVIPSYWIFEFAKKQEATIRFLHDDHSFTQNISKLPDIITNIINFDTKNINH